MTAGPRHTAPHPSWSDLPAGARLFRLAHVAWGVVSMLALAVIWRSALTGRRDRTVVASVAWLLVEGAALLVGRGDCPMGSVQRRLGDPVPMFELVLPPRAAKAAIPLLAGVTLAGLAGIAFRALSSRGRPCGCRRPSHP